MGIQNLQQCSTFFAPFVLGVFLRLVPLLTELTLCSPLHIRRTFLPSLVVSDLAIDIVYPSSKHDLLLI